MTFGLDGKQLEVIMSDLRTVFKSLKPAPGSSFRIRRLFLNHGIYVQAQAHHQWFQVFWYNEQNEKTPELSTWKSIETIRNLSWCQYQRYNSLYSAAKNDECRSDAYLSFWSRWRVVYTNGITEYCWKTTQCFVDTDIAPKSIIRGYISNLSDCTVKVPTLT